MQRLKPTTPVAEAEHVKIHCPLDGLYSFFNSPYPAHRLHAGVDIYCGGEFGGTTTSPVNGIVQMIRQVKAPKGKGFVDAGHDTIILIRTDENPEVLVKLLHVDPLVEVGDHITTRDIVGTLIRSGYYGWGTSPHVHIEVRSFNDPLRARGGHIIRRLITPIYSNEPDKIGGYVIESRPEYSIIRLSGESYGLVGEIDGTCGVIDGGIPYYGWMGVHVDNPTKGEVKLQGKTIGEVKNVFPSSVIADTKKFRFELNGNEILGLSLYLSPVKKPIAKALPLKIGTLILEEEQIVEISVST